MAIQPTHSAIRHDAGCRGAGVGNLGDEKIVFSNTLLGQCLPHLTPLAAIYAIPSERRFDRFQFAKCALSLDGDESLAAPMGHPGLTQSPLYLLRD